MDQLSNLIFKNEWHNIANQYEPNFLAKNLLFKEGRSLAYKMLFNDERDDSLRDYAVELLKAIHQAHPKEWKSDWRNDVFLGDACYMTMKYDERYQAYKRAYEKANPPPPSLLISLASCYLSPEPLISLNEAEKMAKKALDQEMSVEGVLLLRGIYAEQKDQSNFDYWDKVLKEVEEKDLHTQNAWPDIHS